MRTEQEIMEKLEDAVGFMEHFHDTYSEIPAEQIPREKRDQLNASFMTTLLLSWVLNKEAETEPLVQEIRNAANRL